MYINFKSVQMTPNPVNTGSQFILSVEVELTTWERLKAYAWSLIKKFTWKDVKEDPID